MREVRRGINLEYWWLKEGCKVGQEQSGRVPTWSTGVDVLQWSTQLGPPSSLSVALWDEAGPPGCTPPRGEGERKGGRRREEGERGGEKVVCVQ